MNVGWWGCAWKTARSRNKWYVVVDQAESQPTPHDDQPRSNNKELDTVLPLPPSSTHDHHVDNDVRVGKCLVAGRGLQDKNHS